MLKVMDVGVLRAPSLDSLAVSVEVNALRGAISASVDDRAMSKNILQFVKQQQLGAPPTSNIEPRGRSNSTILPSKDIQTIMKHNEEMKLNVFDQSPYKEMASSNKKFEMALGKRLSCSSEVAAIAKAIRENTGSPMRFADFSPQQQQKIKEESAYIGGAKELLSDMDTLDAHVLATLIKAEGKEYDLGEMERRKCMFNHVRSPDNPIFPWNSHRFDLEIFEVTNPIQYTEEVRNLIADRWAELLERNENIEGYLFDELGVSDVDFTTGVLNVLQDLSEANRKKLLKDVLHISWSTESFVTDERNARESNPLGSEFRQHTTGAKSNVVRVSDKEDKSVNKWVYEAIVHGKPVTSGPSGHTLRYLNHYAMCSEMHNLSGSNTVNAPSLEEARLVMLANLIAPKEHHSYHEIMLASIGVYNGVDVLEYNHKGSYDDLKSTRIGLEMLGRANDDVAGL